MSIETEELGHPRDVLRLFARFPDTFHARVFYAAVAGLSAKEGSTHRSVIDDALQVVFAAAIISNPKE